MDSYGLSEIASSKALSDLTGLDYGGAFGRVERYIQKNKIEQAKDVPDDVIGDVLAMTGQLEGLFLELLIAPKLGMAKLAAVLAVSSASSAFLLIAYSF